MAAPGSVVLDEELPPDYEPSQEEVVEYAKWLGMDIETESNLLWIAREGIKAPLPANWRPCKSSGGDIYYFNFATGESRWDHPIDDYYKELYRKERNKNLARVVEDSTSSSDSGSLKARKPASMKPKENVDINATQEALMKRLQQVEEEGQKKVRKKEEEVAAKQALEIKKLEAESKKAVEERKAELGKQAESEGKTAEEVLKKEVELWVQTRRKELEEEFKEQIDELERTHGLKVEEIRTIAEKYRAGKQEKAHLESQKEEASLQLQQSIAVVEEQKGHISGLEGAIKQAEEARHKAEQEVRRLKAEITSLQEITTVPESPTKTTKSMPGETEKAAGTSILPILAVSAAGVAAVGLSFIVGVRLGGQGFKLENLKGLKLQS